MSGEFEGPGSGGAGSASSTDALEAVLLTLPVQPNNPSQEMIVTLDGRRYLLRLDWNARIGRWFLDLETETGTPIVRCKCLALRSDVLRIERWRVDAPPGVIMVIDTLGADVEAGLPTLGARHRLVYFSEQ